MDKKSVFTDTARSALTDFHYIWKDDTYIVIGGTSYIMIYFNYFSR